MAASGAPLAIPTDVQEVILFGGTFDPPTKAHVHVADRVRSTRAPSAWLVIIPAARSPHKNAGPAASDLDRIAMARLAFEPLGRCFVWEDEIARGDEPSFTIETVRRASAALGRDVRVFLLIGSDQAAAFHRWKDSRELLELTEPVVFVRAPDATPQDCLDRMRTSGAWNDADLRAWRGRILALPPVEGSATAARQMLRSGHDGGFVLPTVLDYIRRHGLYR